MNKKMVKTLIGAVLLLCFGVFVLAASPLKGFDGVWLISSIEKVEVQGEITKIIYRNTEYGFSFSLPESWKDYRVLTEKWEGRSMDDRGNGEITETGPLVKIRHPEWTSQNPRQDIPIMVFTLAQWESMQRGEFHIGAAPIGPKELGRNKKYVFALPARYNYAFPTGYEEVERILETNPLKPFAD